MDVSLDITKEFEDLKAAFTCGVCKNLLLRPVTLATCAHTICKDCLDASCPICDSPYFERDVEEDAFSAAVLLSINNIEAIFAEPVTTSLVVEGFKVVTVQTVMKRNPKGETPLHTACKKGSVDKTRELLLKIVDVNSTDYANWCPLHEAVESGSYDCCRLLLQNGASPDVPGEFYTTPLHKAVTSDDSRIVELLLEHGADTNAVNYFGKNARDLSVSNGVTEVLENAVAVAVEPKVVFLSPFPVAFCPDASKENKERLSRLNVKFVSADNFVKREDVTHLVLRRNEKLNVQIFLAVVKGVFVVDEQWIKDCVSASCNVVSFDYAADDRYREALKKSILNRWMRRPKLFDGISFHVLDYERPERIHGVNLTRRDLITLIEQGGGRHLIRSPALRTVEGRRGFPYHVDGKSDLTMCCNYIVYGKSKVPELLYNMRELRHKSSEWLIDCILGFCIVDT